MAVGVDGGDNLRIVGGFHCQRGASVESFLSGEYPAAAGGERGELQTVLVGLGAAVHQKQLVVGIAAYGTQAFGQLALQRVHHGVGVEAYLAQLAAHGLHIVGMAVSDADHGMSAVEVEVFGAGIVVDAASLAAYDVHAEEWVYVV